MKIYTFITTERVKSSQGAHKFERFDVRIGSAALSIPLAEIEVKAVAATTIRNGRERKATIYTLTLDGVIVAESTQVEGGGSNVRRFAEIVKTYQTAK